MCVRPDPTPALAPCSLVLEGEDQPVSAQTVQFWLAVANNCLNSVPVDFSEDLNDFYPVLLFAEAVDSHPRFYKAVMRLTVQQPRLHLDLPSLIEDSPEGDEQPTRLRIRLSGVLFSLGEHWYNYTTAQAIGEESDELKQYLQGYRARTESGDWIAAFSTSVVANLERWLYLAGKLQLMPLMRLLLDFIKLQQLQGEESLLRPAAGSLLSPRVLQHMPRGLLLEGFVRNFFAAPASTECVEGGTLELTEQTNPIVHKWMGLKSGERRTWSIRPGAGYLHIESTRLMLWSAGRFLPLSLHLGGFDDASVDLVTKETVERCLAAEQAE